jgi:hypothetical protein
MKVNHSTPKEISLMGRSIATSFFIISFMLFLMISACEEDDLKTNPFDEQEVNQDTVRLAIDSTESATIAGIYYNVFKPTCANVGCHDGTFEPDFRTLESSYNTLVHEPPIKNDGNFTYRVDPGSVETSVIMARLNNLISPPMPIQLEPDSDWFEKGDDYIDDIKTWIENGALDIMGEAPTLEAEQIKARGVFAMQKDSIYRRNNIEAPLRLPLDSSQQSYIYFSLEHPTSPPSPFSVQDVAFSTESDDFDGKEMKELEYIPTAFEHYGYQGLPVDYHFRVQIYPEDFEPGQRYYFRVYVKDDQNPLQELPGDEALYHIKNYYSIEWTE